MPPLDLTGRVALVTGSSRGIGLSIARRFAEHGASVVLNGRHESDELASIAAELERAHGVRTMVVGADVGDPSSVSAMMSRIFKTFKRLDILVNNAGVLRDALIGMISEDDITATVATNAAGTIRCIQAGARLIERSGGGSIINMASIIGVRGNVGQLVYGASKGAVVAATLSAAKELAAKNIRVNAIAPGYIDTDMSRSVSAEVQKERIASIAMNRVGLPEDIANVALFLASDLAGYVTGQVIGVDGGMLI